MLIPSYFVQSGGSNGVVQTRPVMPTTIGPANPNPWPALLVTGLLLGGLWWAVGTLPDPPRVHRRRRRYTYEPVSSADREYVSLRDGWRCTYCGRRVTRQTRHIDHSVSRANGGTNHLNNLRLSCGPCNLGKGPLNYREFVRGFWRQVA